jgi:hypothetical protein
MVPLVLQEGLDGVAVAVGGFLLSVIASNKTSQFLFMVVLCTSFVTSSKYLETV